MKKIISLFLVIVLSIGCVSSVNAAENKEWFDMEIVENNLEIAEEDTNPCTQYIINVVVFTKKEGTNKIYIRGDVLCSDTMKNIKTYFYLQKNYGSGWVTVASNSATKTNVSSSATTVSVSDLTSGVYRAKVSGTVTNGSGYSETLTNYSDDITIG